MVDIDLGHLPGDIDQSHRVILELLEERARFLDKQAEQERLLADRERSYRELHEQYELLRQMYFGRSSEKLTEEDIRQMHLFNEAESGLEELHALSPQQAATVPIAEHLRRKPGRKPLADHLPREIVIHDLSEEEKRCPCCGKERPLVNEEATEEAEVIPAKVKVVRHVRRVYGPCSCNEFVDSGAPSMIRSPMPPRMIPGSIAGPGLLAYVLTAKFVDGLPFYRQETIFARLGIELNRATLCGWAIAVGAALGPLIDLLWEKLLEGPLVNMDETTLQVLNEPGRAATAQSYMWVNLGYVDPGEPSPLKRIILYHYHPTRSQEVPLEVLKSYEGYLQTDAYGGYNEIGKKPCIIHVGCWTHARRLFHDASAITKKAGSAEVALAFIAEIYRIEKTLREPLAKGTITREQFAGQRSELVKPILARFRAWIEQRIDQVPPKTALGKALHYTYTEWPKLERYLDAWFLTPDNNVVENAIRPFVVGRKGWLFADTPRGAHASATIYSLVETAKANGLEPYHYFRHLFSKLPAATGREDYERLLPTALLPKDLLPLENPNRPP